MLYQDVRPTTLNKVFGNKAAKAQLQRALDNPDNRAHVYLFYGASGCGKTTLARIMGLSLTNDPSNIIEINAANERGVATARELDKFARHTPLGGGNRVVLLDEAHMLTSEAQNCLLKTLEDIPPHCYYFLCSTEPKKLKPTIRGRAELVEVAPLKKDDLFDLIDDVLVQDSDRIPDPGDDVIAAIVRACEGCPRQALVLLEQTIGMEPLDALNIVKRHLNGASEMIELCRKMVERTKSWNGLVKIYNALEDHDPERVRRCLMGYFAGCLKRSKSDAEGGKFADMILDLSENTYDAGEPKLLAMMFTAYNR